MTYYPARATIDLGAIRTNVAALRERTAADMMAVVKADGYGHGLVPVARNAVAAGANWLGTAHITEALQLRRAGLTCRILVWLYTPGSSLEQCVNADIDLSVSALWALEEVVAGARTAGRPARIHLKVDTGMGRSGVTEQEYPELLAAALRAQEVGDVSVVGLWSHLACADDPDHRANSEQLAAFQRAVALAEDQGAALEVRHLANSAATLLSPEYHFDLVRPGLAIYGLTPAPKHGSAADFGLRPAMTLSADLALVKDVPAGQGVSYDLMYTTERATRLGVVPLGYGDGIPRHASNRAQVLAGSAASPADVPGEDAAAEVARAEAAPGERRRVPLAGRVCMDQFVIDLGSPQDAAAGAASSGGGPAGEPQAAGPSASELRAGDEVVLFGPGDHGEPTAQDWAEAAETISYEIVTRLGPRIPRVYQNG